MEVLLGKNPSKLRQRAPSVPPGGSVTASPLRSASFLAKVAIAKNMFTNQHRTPRTGGDCAEKLVPRARRGLGGPPRYSTPALGLITRRAHLALQRYDTSAGYPQDAAEWRRRVNSVRPLKFKREARLADAGADTAATTAARSHGLDNRTAVVVVTSAINRGGNDARSALADGQRRGDTAAAGDAAAQQGPRRSNRLRGAPLAD